jgi:hypothetical protein
MDLLAEPSQLGQVGAEDLDHHLGPGAADDRADPVLNGLLNLGDHTGNFTHFLS